MDFTATMIKDEVCSDTDSTSDLTVHNTVNDIGDVLDSSGNSNNSEDVLPKRNIPKRILKKYSKGNDRVRRDKELISYRRVQRFTKSNSYIPKDKVSKVTEDPNFTATGIKEYVHSDMDSASDINVYYTVSDIDEVLDSSCNSNSYEDVLSSSLVKQNVPQHDPKDKLFDKGSNGEDHATTEKKMISSRHVQRFPEGNCIPKDRTPQVDEVYPTPPAGVRLTSRYTRVYTDSFRRFSLVRQAMRKRRVSPTTTSETNNTIKSSKSKDAWFRLYGHTLMCLGIVGKKPKAL